MASIVIRVEGSGSDTSRLVFSASPVRIGRNSLNNVVLDHGFVSQWHGLVRFDDSGINYFDLGSTNGTRMGGKRVAKNVPVPVLDQATFEIGPLRLIVERAVAEPAAATGPVALRMPQLPTQFRAQQQSTPVTPSVTPPPRPELTAVLEGFCAAFIGLRKGFEQFGNEVGVRPVAGKTPLHRAQNADEILAYLAEPGADTSARIQELNGIFAELGMHHVALLDGVSESVRQLLVRLDPTEHDPDGGGLLRRRERSQWKEYLESYAALRDDDQERHNAIFGSEFARAYAEVAAGGEPDPDDDDP